jgi:hypothetical protein
MPPPIWMNAGAPTIRSQASMGPASGGLVCRGGVGGLGAEPTSVRCLHYPYWTEFSGATRLTAWQDLPPGTICRPVAAALAVAGCAGAPCAGSLPGMPL